jgi:hypothetical protein
MNILDEYIALSEKSSTDGTPEESQQAKADPEVQDEPTPDNNSEHSGDVLRL